MIDRSFVFRIALSVAWFYAGVTAEVGSAQPKRPNVILIMTDDQGYGDMSCHGNKVLHTPNIDALYKQSVRLTDFHVDPTCSPTRSALLTGRYSPRTGVWHTIMGRSLLRVDEVTLADLFRAAGYRTGIFGKWHLGDNFPYRVQDRGFDESLVHGGGGITQTPDAWGNTYFSPRLWKNGELIQTKGYCTDVFFDAAMKFIRKHRDRPFFCYIPTNVPHGPFQVAEKYSNMFKGQPNNLANFYGMLKNFDENLGRLLLMLKNIGLEENTIVVFMTDNGTAGRGFNAGMRGRKGSEYDGGHRVPCFLRWPAAWKGGRDVPVLAAHIDIVPTLADLCKFTLPKDRKIDGKSLRPLLERKDSWPDRVLFVQSHRIEHPKPWRKSAVMTQQYRLVNGAELFDMTEDPGQKNNIAEQNPKIVEKLREAYETYYKDVSKRFDEYCPIYIGAGQENSRPITCHDWHSDNVPWSQSRVKQSPKANGFWAIKVVKPGKYRFTLRAQPAEANYELKSGTAKLKIGDAQATVPIKEGTTGVSLEMKLPAGEARMQTWLMQEGRGERGAFFVEVKRVVD